MQSNCYYVRFESPFVNSRGNRPGVFALANGLAHSATLSAKDFAWWRQNNDWFNAAYADPATVSPGLFDRAMNPRVECWFKLSAEHLLVRISGYLDLLDRYETSWVARYSLNPGSIIYEDDVQVVVVPNPHGDRRS